MWQTGNIYHKRIMYFLNDTTKDDYQLLKLIYSQYTSSHTIMQNNKLLGILSIELDWVPLVT
jgi:hypothetical protein